MKAASSCCGSVLQDQCWPQLLYPMHFSGLVWFHHLLMSESTRRTVRIMLLSVGQARDFKTRGFMSLFGWMSGFVSLQCPVPAGTCASFYFRTVQITWAQWRPTAPVIYPNTQVKFKTLQDERSGNGHGLPVFPPWLLHCLCGILVWAGVCWYADMHRSNTL